MIKLDNRLSAVADILLTHGGATECVCDVGTDHGYICVYLVQNGFKRAVATDISAPSAEKARLCAGRFGLSDSIDVRVGDGLKTVAEGEADAAVIAGMGGLTIAQIMADAPKSIRRFVLQPMKSDYELRCYLCSNGFTIADETLAKESGKLYNIILAERGAEEFDADFDMYIGGRLVRSDSPYLNEYYLKKLKELDKKIKGQSASGTAPDGRLLGYKDNIKKLMERGAADVQC